MVAFINCRVELRVRLADVTRWGTLEGGKGWREEEEGVVDFSRCLCQEISVLEDKFVCCFKWVANIGMASWSLWIV